MRGKKLIAGALLLGAIFVGLAGGVASAQSLPPRIRSFDRPYAIKDRYIVVYKNNYTPIGVRAYNTTPRGMTEGFGGRIRTEYRHALRGFSATMTREAALKVAANPAVAYVEQDAIIKADGLAAEPVTQTTQVNPPSWGLDRIDQRALPLDSSYTYPNTASNVTAYVIDGGMRITHQDFGSRASYGYDFYDGDNIADDCRGHGTYVAGTIGGTDYGVAKNVKLVAVRVLDCEGNGSYADMIGGIDWVTSDHHGPAVVNMSIGGPIDEALDSAVQSSIKTGLVYVVSAGNKGADACTQSPADVPEAITVGNVTANDARYTGTNPNLPSNYGPCVDLFAPGTAIVSAYNTSDTATYTMTGSSMAAPHAAGVAALILAAHPTWTPQQVRDAMVADATSGVLGDIGTGSPNKLLHVNNSTISNPPTACGPFTNSKAVPIPDGGNVKSSIKVSGCKGNALANSSVSVTIKHPYSGNIKIYLVAADGSKFLLKNSKSGDSSDNVKATYTVDLSSQKRNQTWSLRVYDVTKGNTGKLNSWTLRP